MDTADEYSFSDIVLFVEEMSLSIAETNSASSYQVSEFLIYRLQNSFSLLGKCVLKNVFKI